MQGARRRPALENEDKNLSEQTLKPTVGFIGLGAMGSAMVKRIAEGGYRLKVLDVDTERAGRLARELGASLAATPADLAQDCDVVITMLPTSAIVEDVLFGTNGAGDALQPGAIFIEMSSGAPAQTVEMATRIAKLGATLVDAPVSGGVARARVGDLAIMFGGSDQAYAQAEPVLRTMGSSIVRTGAVGSAHAMKALNNLVSAGGFLIGAEALLIGTRFGLDAETMVDVLNASTGMNNSTQKKFKQFVLSRKFDAGFGLDLMVKDIGIALGIADKTETGAPFAALCRQLWSGAQKHLGPGHDHTEMVKFSELLAGSPITPAAGGK
ncbi:NAD(P)-dependent oxidoreductase [Chelatococcus asaccharovorans]|uniref:NAD(P)-dependent oxidoreductase n=1 Tax=Chelatococcus asaccharovorans TaxID=28210 RepID=UPI00224C73C3|nr:NAD(P)-dependent oxidoreductase [Chelatococcus asaccharovorans]CAH1649718.1 3-hydroxyisobutyrate dehydrogenase [Chelatococcus asaccharovorans]CAH1691772.1 3-hydroxyisobutyrate dehydrogenase [Chelatococcus asaccharovorans]